MQPTEKKLCKDNIQRVLTHLHLDNLISLTDADDPEHPDRVYGWPIGPALRRRLRQEGWAHDPNLIAGAMHGEGSDSYREPTGVHPALQIVFHPDPDYNAQSDGGPQYEFAELDLDLSAPVDVADTIGHAAEVLDNLMHSKKTDQEKIARLLDRRFRTQEV